MTQFIFERLVSGGVADAIIRKITGHRPDELERYKHFSPAFKQQTVELIAGQLTRQLDTKWVQSLDLTLYPLLYRQIMAEPTGLEPATSDVTGRRSNQLNYDSARELLNFNRRAWTSCVELNLVGTVGFEPTTSAL